MYLTLRLDDITPELDMDRFTRFCALMDAFQIKPLLGVVPDAQDEALFCTGKKATEEERKRFFDHLRTLRDTKGYRIAMHGCTHVYTTKAAGLFPLNRQSEFAGRSYGEQLRMLQKGSDILHDYGLDTDIFMPPSHTFDADTLLALRATGFSKVTDGFGQLPYRYQDITFYPISFLRGRSIKQAAARQEAAHTNPSQGAVTLVVHPNTLMEAEFAAYERVFATKAFLPYTSLETLPVKTLSTTKHLTHYLMASAKRIAR